MKCSWCNAENEGGNWHGNYVCFVCFPMDKRIQARKKQIKPVRRCESCKKTTNEGDLISGSWVCADCCPFFQKSNHMNKYAKFSKAHLYGGTNTKIPQIIREEEPKHKRKKNKPRHPKGLKKITYWKVVITDISDGKL